MSGSTPDIDVKINKYKEHVLKWNDKISLVSRKDPERVLDRLVSDSIQAMNYLPENIKNVVDIGSGSGLPGIPQALQRQDLEFTLIERSQKKCHFLKNTVSRLGLKNVQVINAGYAPELMPEKGETAVTTLGVGQYIVLIDSLRHKLHGSGGFLFFVNKDFAAELACHVSCETFIWQQLSQDTITGVLWLPV
jgi:16S rRNA (guanine527-N7)-methyltransferase